MSKPVPTISIANQGKPRKKHRAPPAICSVPLSAGGCCYCRCYCCFCRSSQEPSTLPCAVAFKPPYPSPVPTRSILSQGGAPHIPKLARVAHEGTATRQAGGPRCVMFATHHSARQCKDRSVIRSIYTSTKTQSR